MGRYRRRRRDNSLDFLGTVFFYVLYLYVLLIVFMVKILLIIIQLIIFYGTKYKEKSGNGFLKTYFHKGTWAEYKLYRKLIKVFGEDKLLTNLYLPSQNIDNTEIDVLGVHNGIVYCYEVKNYGGYIYGSEEDKYWTQVLNYRIKNRFYNPIRQNYAHVKALESFLSIESQDIVPIIVFSNRSNLDNIELYDSNVFRLNSKFYTLDRIGKYSDELLIEKLSSCSNMSEQVKREHLNQINKLKD